MKRIIQLEDVDLRILVAKEYNVPLDNVISVYTEDDTGCDIYYIEVELKGE